MKNNYKLLFFLTCSLLVGSECKAQISKYSQPYSLSPRSSNTDDLDRLTETLSRLQDKHDKNYVTIQNKINNSQSLINMAKKYNSPNADKYQKSLSNVIEILNGEKTIKYSNGTVVDNDITNLSFYTYIINKLNLIETEISNQ